MEKPESLSSSLELDILKMATFMSQRRNRSIPITRITLLGKGKELLIAVITLVTNPRPYRAPNKYNVLKL